MRVDDLLRLARGGSGISATEQSRIDRARGALLGTFVGDALGMPFEGAQPEEIPERLEMLEARMGRGTYTDDTEMMIGLAESLVDCDSVDAPALARRFLDGHDPRRGYGMGTLRVLAYWREGIPVHSAAKLLFGGEGSLGNGAAMRIAPIGVSFADDPERLRDEARASAVVTHTHPQGIDAAVAQAAAVGAAVRGGDPLQAARSAVATSEMRLRLTTVEQNLLIAPPTPERVVATFGNGPAAIESVPAAIYAACSAPDFRSAVTFAIRCGGDTDTIGAMAGAIAGARDGASTIPVEWLDALEDGPRGRSHVERLADALA